MHRPFREGGQKDVLVQPHNPYFREGRGTLHSEQAIQMLAGTKDSAEFIKHYCELRRSGRPIAQALVLVGHEFRLSQAHYRLAVR